VTDYFQFNFLHSFIYTFYMIHFTTLNLVLTRITIIINLFYNYDIYIIYKRLLLYDDDSGGGGGGGSIVLLE
ncbi:hypothetical protein DERF_004288, partial [Dermatophagoides farinae]